MYLTIKTRLNLAFLVGYLARYIANLGLTHFKLLNKVWKYLVNTLDLGLWSHSNLNSINYYVDAN